jgi:RNA polymerase sigma-70 factor (ECF subfamily)
VLQSAVDSLPAAQREAVHHLAINDETLAEAAAATNRSKIALKVNLHRALATLRARLLGEER